MPNSSIHDPAAKLDYSFDWTAWLANEGTTISTYTVTVSGGVTKVTDSRAAGVVTVRITAASGGSITCHIVCADGQEDERTYTVKVQQR